MLIETTTKLNNVEAARMARDVLAAQAAAPAIVAMNSRRRIGPYLGVLDRSVNAFAVIQAVKGPFRVNSTVLTVGRSLPVYPNEQTFSGSVGMSQRCHIRTSR